MSFDSKYILYKVGALNSIIVFPDLMGHNEMASSLNLTKDRILAAGFISLYTRGAICFGKSQSLGKETQIDTSYEATALLYPCFKDDLMDGSHPIKRDKIPDRDTVYLIQVPYDELAKEVVTSDSCKKVGIIDSLAISKGAANPVSFGETVIIQKQIRSST